MVHLGRRLKEKARKDPSGKNTGLNALTWDYTLEGALREPKVEEVLQEINGWTMADRKLVSGYKDLKADGSTACGCWIYSGIFPKPGENLRENASLKISMGTAGDLRGPATAAFSTIAHPLAPMAALGVSEKNWFGGMRIKKNGSATMFPTSRRPRHRITGRRTAAAGTMP